MFMIVTALMMAQAPAAVQPAPVPQKAAKKAKPQQVCEYFEITGSRQKQRVCHDVNQSADLTGYGVSDSGFGKAKIDGRGTGSTAPAIPQ